MKKKELAYVEEFLSIKSWSLFKTSEEANLKNVIFSFNKNDYSEQAQSFIAYMYSDYGNPNRIYIQMNLKNVYNNYISTLKSYNCKLIETSVEDANVIKVYQGKTTTFIVKVIIKRDEEELQLEPSTNLYTFYIMDNLDYYENFKN